jgi:hypothetical protein
MYCKGSPRALRWSIALRGVPTRPLWLACFIHLNSCFAFSGPMDPASAEKSRVKRYCLGIGGPFPRLKMRLDDEKPRGLCDVENYFPGALGRSAPHGPTNSNLSSVQAQPWYLARKFYATAVPKTTNVICVADTYGTQMSSVASHATPIWACILYSCELT